MPRPLLPPTFDARLVGRRTLSSSVCELTFERTDGEAFSFDAGQWVSLVLPHARGGEIGESGELRRAYSIASPPNGTPRFDLAVTRVEGGPGSTYLHALAPGATVRAIGPQGFFTRPLASAAPSLFVATGTGLTPFRSMIEAAVAAGHPAPMWLLFGVRHEHDVLYANELAALARRHPPLRVEISLSQPGPSWTGRHGYVQTHVEGLWKALEGLGAGAPHAYVCGLQKMVSSVRELLRKDLGVGRERVHTERYD